MTSFRLKISGMLEIMGVFLSSRNHHIFTRWRGLSETGSGSLEEESVTRPSCKECKLIAGGSCKTAMLWPRIVLRPGNLLREQTDHWDSMLFQQHDNYHCRLQHLSPRSLIPDWSSKDSSYRFPQCERKEQQGLYQGSRNLQAIG